MNGQSPHFSIQLKPVGSACNILCDYCYVKPFRSKSLEIMPLEILDRVIKQCLRFSATPILTWHGGEPTLAGYDFFAKAIELMKKYQKQEQTVRNTLQTNAILITAGFADLLKQSDFAVSVSLDGPEPIHGIHRKNCSGKNTFSLVMKGLKRLRSAGIEPSVICTVTKQTAKFAEEVFRFLVSSGFKRIKYSLVFESETDSFSLSSEEWLAYLEKVFRVWFEISNPEIHVRELDEVMLWLQNKTLPVCSSNRTCLCWVSVDPNGDMYPCEYLRSSHAYGNILNMDLPMIAKTEAFRNFAAIFQSIPSECASCEFYTLCGNGCPSTRLRDNKINPNGVYVYCQERRALYQIIKQTFETELGRQL